MTDPAGRAARPDATPDLPQPYADWRCWFLVKTGDAAAVVAALKLRTVLPANWCDGIEHARREGVFVSPPVDGFVLVIGRDAASERVAEILAQLSRRFGEAQWFYSLPEQIDGGWACARDGVVTRHYLFDGQSGEVVVDEGDLTRAERELAFFVDDPRDQSDDPVKWWPSHDDVLALAARWGLDPRAFGQRARPAAGVIGRL